MRRILTIISLMGLSSCASMLGGLIPSGGDEKIEQSTAEDEKAEQAASRKSNQKMKSNSTGKPKAVASGMVTKNAMQGLELKQARLWARVDELEDLIRRQKGRIKMLEKGLLLGVVPANFGEEQLKTEKPMSSSQRVLSKSSMKKEIERTEEGNKNNGPIQDNEDKEKFHNKMAKARDLFRSGRYGKAYLSFSRIDKEFSTSVASGEQKYWLGRCWYKLKEYQSARQHLQAFIGQYPTTPWTPSAKFYLAKVELDLGLKEAAIRRFQQIIRENPYEGTAEAAKQILGTMHKAL